MKNDDQMSPEVEKWHENVISIQNEDEIRWMTMKPMYDEILVDEDSNEHINTLDKEDTAVDINNEVFFYTDEGEPTRVVNTFALIDIEEITQGDDLVLLELVNCVWTEIKNFPSFFNKVYCLESVVFRVIFPSNDIISDFLIAHQMYESENTYVQQIFTSLSYFIIALPGIMILYNLLRRYSFFQDGKIQVVLAIATYIVLFFVLQAPPKLCMPLSYLVSSGILLVGFLNVFCHGPHTRKLSNIVTGYEGLYESVPQMILQLTLLFAGEVEWNITNIYSVCSSFLMLGKDLSEEMIKKGDINISQNMSFVKKIIQISKVIPVIVLNDFFRCGSVALILSHFLFVIEYQHQVIWMCNGIMTIYLPLITLMCARKCSPLTKELSILDCFSGILGNWLSIAKWGNLNMYQSRWIHFVLFLYYTIYYGSYLVWAMVNPTSPYTDLYAFILFCAGWTSIPLYIRHMCISIDMDNKGNQENLRTEEVMNQDSKETEFGSNHDSRTREEYGNQININDTKVKLYLI